MQRLADIEKMLELPAVSEGMAGGFSIDSRLVKAGDLFFALKGCKSDGHDFLKEIAGKKAIGAVVADTYRGPDFGLILIKVPDVVEALQSLAKQIFAMRTPKHVIGVTGSVGKTTTKEFIATLLEEKFRIGKTLGNANSQVSLPLTILNSPGDEEVLIYEIGMSQPGEIEKLVDIAPPDIGVITYIGVAHVGYFENGIEGVAAAKAQILAHPKTKLGIISDQALRYESVQKTGACQKLCYALENSTADYILRFSREGFRIDEKGRMSPLFILPFDATHLCADFLAAAAVARSVGLEWEEIIARAQFLAPYKMRFERIDKHGIVFINDAYNANPDSMRAALANLPKPATGAKCIAVFGEMVELGNYSHTGHREVAEIALHNIDHLLCYGEGCMAMVEVFIEAARPVDFFADIAHMRQALHDLAQPGDVVLIKGSNSNKLWRVLE